MLTRKEFYILELLATRTAEIIFKKNIEVELNQDIEQVIRELQEKCFIYIEGGEEVFITKQGLEVLEPYRVKRAIFIAAGLGSRLRPYTNELPKPLIQVNGKSMIETMLEAVVEVGIEEIIIVRGYFKEKFDVLKEKYSNIKFIDNDFYDKYNNVYSAYLVKEYIESAYLLDADLVLYNKDIIKKYQYKSNYIGKYKEYTEDWCLEVKDGKIVRMKLGGEDCYHMYGISYWDKQCGNELAKDIAREIEKNEAKDIYWDEVALNLYERDVEVRACQEDDLIEIDTAEELEAINDRGILKL